MWHYLNRNESYCKHCYQELGMYLSKGLIICSHNLSSIYNEYHRKVQKSPKSFPSAFKFLQIKEPFYFFDDMGRWLGSYQEFIVDKLWSNNIWEWIEIQNLEISQCKSNVHIANLWWPLMWVGTRVKMEWSDVCFVYFGER